MSTHTETPTRPATERVACPRCGAEWSDVFAFCPRCGGRLAGASYDGAEVGHRSRRAHHAIVPAVAVCGLIVICLAALIRFGPARVADVQPTPIATPVVVFVPAPTATPAPTPTPVPTPMPTATPTPPPFRSMTFVVPPTRSYTLTLQDVRSGNVVEGSFSATGGHGDVDFQLRAPNGGVLDSASRSVGPYAFHVVARQDGYYVLWFGNTFSLFTSKTVSLELRDYPMR